MSDPKELVKYITRFLASNPEAVVVREIEGATATVYELSVAPEDMGRIIGKGGRVVNAMRTLLRAIAAREGKRVTLEIM